MLAGLGRTLHEDDSTAFDRGPCPLEAVVARSDSGEDRRRLQMQTADTISVVQARPSETRTSGCTSIVGWA